MDISVSSKIKPQTTLTQTLPEKYNRLRIPDADIQYCNGPFGYYIVQRVRVHHYYVVFYYFSIAKRVRLYASSKTPLLILNCMLFGALDCKLNGWQQISLSPGNMEMFYMSPETGRNTGFFSKGHFQAINLEMDETHLSDFFNDYPGLEKLYREKTAARNVSVKFPTIPMGIYVMSCIQKILKSIATKGMALQNHINSIFLDYFKNLGATPTGEGKKAKRVIEDVFSFIDESIDDNITLGKIAESYGVHVSTLTREFKKKYGVSIRQYIISARMEKAKALLANREMKLHDIATTLGFSDQAHFSNTFRRTTGMTPTEFRCNLKSLPQKGSE